MEEINSSPVHNIEITLRRCNEISIKSEIKLLEEFLIIVYDTSDVS